ncbi:response regulator transcription factor [Cupriavidus respiraculi]|uniref:helix-turn-helix transcriptional regulator n=1 Tax=Cupriavidus respiraculi TaxID=195930 RepID=UPI001C97CF16|nr:response regulator transcription factor [Cupriavidus respiraculi]MBY4949690.1 response regulator transcription factor [Cupriavidus respiraculi]
MATILLIEPHPLLRLGLRHLLAHSVMPEDIIDIDPTTIARAEDAWLPNADLLIYGLSTNGDTSWQPLEQLCQWFRPQRVLVLADGMHPAMADAVVPDIVCGLLSKACSADILDAAIRLVLAGGECFPAWTHGTAAVGAIEAATCAVANEGTAAQQAMPPVSHTAQLPEADPHLAEIETPSIGAHLLNITERQYEVLVLLARGYPIKTISRALNISAATAKTHACTLYQRLQVRNKGEAVYEALRRGAKLNWPGPTMPVPASPAAATPIRLEPSLAFCAA